MNYSRHRRPPSAADVGGGAGNRPGGGQTGKQGRSNVGHPLGHQLGVRVVLIFNHAVGHHGTEQRLDGGQQRDGKGGLNQKTQRIEVHFRPVRHRQFARNGVRTEPAAEGFDADGRRQQQHHGRTRQDCGQRRRKPAGPGGRPQLDQRERRGRQGRRRPVDVLEVTEKESELVQKVRRHLFPGVQLQTEEVADLRAKNVHGDSCGEAAHHGERDVLDHGSQARQAHRDQDQAGERGADDQVIYSILLGHAENDGNEGGGWSANLHLRAAQGRDQETRHNGGDDSHGGGTIRGDSQRHTEGQGDDAHGDPGREIGQEVSPRIRLERVEELRTERNGKGHEPAGQ